MESAKEYDVISPLDVDGEIIQSGSVSLDAKTAGRLLAMDEPPIADPDAIDTEGGDVITQEQIVKAIGDLQADKEDNFTDSGAPKVNVLEDALDQSITAAQRDAAWEAFQNAGD